MSGIDVNKFVDLPEAVAKHLKCCVCLNIYFKPMDTSCKHTFCLNCIQTLIDSNGKVCPICRQLLATRKRSNSESDSVIIGNNVILVRNMSLNNIINDLKIKCKNESNGCKEVIEFSLMSSHENTCAFKLCGSCAIIVDDQSQALQKLKQRLEVEKRLNSEMKEKIKDLEKQLNDIHTRIPSLRSFP